MKESIQCSVFSVQTKTPGRLNTTRLAWARFAGIGMSEISATSQWILNTEN